MSGTLTTWAVDFVRVNLDWPAGLGVLSFTHRPQNDNECRRNPSQCYVGGNTGVDLFGSVLPAPTAAQIEATDAIQFIANANHVRIPLESGDMLFVNDTALMHSREAFDEGQSFERHLVKMVLRDPAQK